MGHVHLHTHFSFGIGVSSPEVLATAAAELGFAALASTNTNGVYGPSSSRRGPFPPRNDLVTFEVR